MLHSASFPRLSSLSLARLFLAVALAGLSAGGALKAQVQINAADALGIWEFDDSSNPARCADLMQATPLNFQGGAAYTADGGGRSGLAGDRALNIGTVAGNHAVIDDAAFMALVNDRIQSADRISIVFWQRWSTAIANSSSVYCVSASAAGTNRGLQAHLPWSDGNIYYDSAGCCASPGQRLSGAQPTGHNWQQWHHVAIIKNGGSKQLWINGNLHLSQATGAAALPADWTRMVVGSGPDGASPMRGLIDDFGVFSIALGSNEITALAGGATPSELVVPLAERPPRIINLTPAGGTPSYPAGGTVSFTASTWAPNTLPAADLRFFINGQNQSSNLSITGTDTSRTATFTGTLPAGAILNFRAEAKDNNGRLTTTHWTIDTLDPATTPTHTEFNLAPMATASLSAVTTPHTANRAIDKDPNTVAASANEPGSFLEVELNRSVTASRLYVTAPGGMEFAGVLDNARVRIFDVRDQLIHESTITTLAPGGTWGIVLPAGTMGRIVRIDLPPGQTNGAGDHRIAVAEIKLVGDPSPAFGPLNLAAIGTVSQSSTSATGYEAVKAIDGNPDSVSLTGANPDEWWLLKLDRTRPVRRIEIVNRLDSNAARLQGLTLRLLDEASATLAMTTVGNPGLGSTWGFDVPAGTPPVRYVRIGLENGATNGQGDRQVQLGDVSVLTGTNFALNTTACMVRLQDTLPSPALANDGDFATHTQTTTATVDGWWETDLGTVQTLYSVRAMGFGGTTDQFRLSRATVRLYDAGHDSVFSAPLSAYQTAGSSVFDVPLPGPVRARYVRVGLEDKTRTSTTGGAEWYLRLKEVQAFGRPAGEAGLYDFAATPQNVGAGGSTTLTWRQDDLCELLIHPGIGSVGAFTSPATGLGALMVAPASTTEYTLVGSDHLESSIHHLTVTVNGQALPPRISEICASNASSLSDGFDEAPDWIETRNPNNNALDLSGYGLSDDPAQPMKWTFPAGTTVPAHGTLLVMASGRNSGPDAKGYLHTNFSLAADGESVVLTLPDGTTTADAIVNYPPQREDLAYGRSAGGQTAFLEPTPGAFNPAATYSGWLDPPAFSHERGFHETAFTLTLANPNPDSQLYYSLDGTEPSVPYSAPLTIAGSSAIRAVVKRSGFHSPRVVTHTYVFKNSVMSSPLMNTTYTQGPLATRLRDSLTQLPSICISVPAIPDDRVEREASVEIFMPDGSPHFQVNGGMVRYGGAYTDFAKKSYRLRFREGFGTNRLRHPIFRGFDHGMAASDEIRTINLNAGNHDMAQRGFYMSQRFVEDSMLEMGSLNPHGRFVHVYINGVYWGQYNAQERLEDSMLASYLGGKTGDYVNVMGNDNVGDEFVPGTPEPPDREAWETARANMSNYDFVKTHVDLPHLTDMMLLWTYGSCESEYRCVGPVVAPGSGFKFWLADADGFLRTTSGDRTDRQGPGGFFGALRTAGNPDFKMMVADRIYQHFFNNGALTHARNLARLNARMTEVNDSLIAECARWNFRTPDNWLTEADNVRNNLFPTRTGTVFNYWKSRGLYPAFEPPVLSKYGGSVPLGYQLSMNSPAGTVYYTVDGSDPRLPGGAVAPGAATVSEVSQTLVSTTGTWKYWSGPSYPAANWHTAAHSDAAWLSGPAPLGYGGGEATNIGYGPSSANKYRTACFRKTFTVANPAAIANLTASIARDDGAVIYINGTEVARTNMPATGTITFDTKASTAVGNTDKFVFQNLTLPASTLVAGENLIAVEVHQINATSSDIYFDLSLTGSGIPPLTLNANTRVKARVLDGSTWSALADASFHIAHPLVSAGPYSLIEWSSTSPAGAYPSAMRFYQTDLVDPALAAAMDTPWTLPYNLTSRSRINGLGTDGIGFTNTGNVQELPGAGYVGAAVLNLDTTGAQGVRVLWTGGTVTPNERDYGIRLQYRVGETGEFTDVLTNGQPVEYLRNPVAGHRTVIGPATLPAAADNQPLVQLRWKYYFRSGTSGARAQLRLDDILVTAGALPPAQMAFESTPASAQSGAPLGSVVVRLSDANGWPAIGFNGPVTLALNGPGSLSGTLTMNASDGTAVFSDLVATGTGPHALTATSGILTAVSPSFRILALDGLLVPQFIQGGIDGLGENNQRVPFAWRARIDGLIPYATYRFANRMATTADTPDNDGAGNMIFVTGHVTDWIRCISGPRFLTEDLGYRHYAFSADGNGSFTGWFVTEPTGNARFTPGNLLHPKLILNDGAGGGTAFHSLTCSHSAQVTEFGSAPEQGSAITGASFAPARCFAVLYSETDGSGRPLAITPVEATGALPDTRYAPFYPTGASASGGRWGTLIPNTLPTGVRRIGLLNTGSAAPLYQIVSASALTGTVAGQPATSASPANGLTPLILNDPENPTAYDQWRALHFPNPGDFANAAVSGPAAMPAGDPVSNIMRYALNLGPLEPVAGLMPTLAGRPAGGFVFRFRHDPAKSDLIWRVLRSPDLTDWSGVEFDSTVDPAPAPGPDGWTEIPLPAVAPHTFWRLMIGTR